MTYLPQSILEHVANLPLKSLLLSGVFCATSLSAFYTWKLIKTMKEAFVTPTITDKLATDQPSDCQKGTNKDLEFQWNVSGATRLGKIRTENQDSFTVWRESVSQIFIAANDGAGGIDGGREASQSAAESALAVMEYTAGSNLSPSQRLEMAIAEARETAKAEKLNGITTAILTYCENDKLHYATLGDGAVVAVWPDGMVSHIQTPHHILGQPDNVIAAYIGQGCEIKPRTGSIRLEPGTTIMLLSLIHISEPTRPY